MRLLVLGGTQFVGRHIVESALHRGHQLTLFNRGRTNARLFPEAETLTGDRDGGLGVLAGRRWDAVVDVNGYLPRLVRGSASSLRGSVDRYAYISTLSVLADPSRPMQDESAALAPLRDPAVETIDGETYGPLKAACERVLEEELPGRALVIRPGFIVGPWDHTGRFTHWLRRVGEGGEMLGPGDPEAPLQFIDARDLASFVLAMVERGGAGPYHAAGPEGEWTWGRLFEECRGVTGAETRVVWIPQARLEEVGVSPRDLPMWAGAAGAGLMRTDCRKAIAAGLRFRPVADTIRDTLAWDAEHRVQDVGLSAEQERVALTAWGARGSVSAPSPRGGESS
jgi:nucleoside-diphosphate-sugar epimerase